MAIVEAEPNDQFQIGDEVLYLPERVITTVIGYDWLTSVGSPPKIVAYQLTCGISAAKDLLQPSISGRIHTVTGDVVWTNRDEFYATPPQRYKAR